MEWRQKRNGEVKKIAWWNWWWNPADWDFGTARTALPYGPDGGGKFIGVTIVDIGPLRLFIRNG